MTDLKTILFKAMKLLGIVCFLIMVLLITLQIAAYNPTFGLAFLVLVLLGWVAFKGYRLPILLKMSLRNVSRRKVNTIIVVTGLMIGTAIISGSLVVGDTLENMFTKDAYDSYDETDETIFTYDENATYAFFNYTEYEGVSDYVATNPGLAGNVEEISPEIQFWVSVLDMDSKLSEPAVRLVGIDYSESEAFGKVKATNGKQYTEEDLAANEVFVNKLMADEMEIKAGHTIQLFMGENQTAFFTVKAIVKNEGRANYGNLFGGASGMNIIMPLEQVQQLLGKEGKINIIKISNKGGKYDGMKHSKDVETELAPYLLEQEQVLLLEKSKKDMVDSSTEGSRELRNLFLVLGFFCILAGLILIFLIFMMLAEERKSEMGMSRAVGMKQKQLMYTFLFEGTAYSVLAAAAGTLAGLGVAYGIIIAFGAVWGGFNSVQFFTFSLESLVLAFIAGMLITLLTIYAASRWVSKLNIIRAIRNIPEPRYSRHELTKIDDSIVGLERMQILLGDTLKREFELLVILLGAFLVFASFVDIGLFFNKAWAGYGGLAIFIYGIGFLLRRYIIDEQAFTIAGGVVLLLWCYPYDIYDQLFGIQQDGDMEMFILSGVFMVSAALMVIMSNSNFILKGLLTLFGRFQSLAPIFKTAVSYPMDNKSRTGMILGMFSLIIFTITALAMIMSLIMGNIDTITEENSGGYDMIANNNPHSPIFEIEERIEENQNLSSSDYATVVPLYTAYTSMYAVENTSNTTRTEQEIQDNLTRPFPGYQENATWYNLIGCSEKFFKNSDYQLQDWDKDSYKDYEDVWEAISKNTSLAIADQSLFAEMMEEYGPPGDGELTMCLGDFVVLRDLNGQGKVVKIIGFTKNQIINGIYVRSDLVTSQEGFNTTSSYITLLKFSDDISEEEQEDLAKDLEREFLPNGMQTFIIKKEIESQLKMLNNFFYLLEAFLGLGLVVGIAGLGIITIRSVTERRQQIGMLRAIGFKRNMIWKSFLIETSYIALLGIFLGVVLGIILGVRFYVDPESDFQGAFVIPWKTILWVSLISYVCTVLCTIGPSRKASEIAPAEALRYIG